MTLDAEGIVGPGELAAVGDEATLEKAIRSYADAGVTDFHAAPFPFGDDGKTSVARTTAWLGSLASR